MKGAAVAVALVASITLVRAQTQASTAASAGQAFDVASIKQNKSGENGGRFGGPPTRWTATNVPALQFILFAYQTQDFLIEGVPDWVKTDRWDINAKSDRDFPPAAIGAPDARRDMLRALLVERFKLVAHKESRDRPIYALVVAQPDKPPAPRLHRSTVDCVALLVQLRRGSANAPPPPNALDGVPECSITLPPGRLTLGTQPMTELAAVLSQIVQRRVVDRTGLTGNFSALVTYAPENSTPDPNAPSIFTALQEQLGLKLESTRGPVDMLVIDRIERPTED